jgi:hypothetical protein
MPKSAKFEAAVAAIDKDDEVLRRALLEFLLEAIGKIAPLVKQGSYKVGVSFWVDEQTIMNAVESRRVFLECFVHLYKKFGGEEKDLTKAMGQEQQSPFPQHGLFADMTRSLGIEDKIKDWRDNKMRPILVAVDAKQAAAGAPDQLVVQRLAEMKDYLFHRATVDALNARGQDALPRELNELVAGYVGLTFKQQMLEEILKVEGLGKAELAKGDVSKNVKLVSFKLLCQFGQALKGFLLPAQPVAAARLST